MICVRRQREIGTNVERDKLYPCSLESLGDIQGEAKETYHQEKHEESLKYVIFERSVGRASMPRGSPTRFYVFTVSAASFNLGKVKGGSVPNQDTIKLRSVHNLNARANVIANLSKLKPVAFSAAVSPMTDTIPTYLWI